VEYVSWICPHVMARIERRDGDKAGRAQLMGYFGLLQSRLLITTVFIWMCSKPHVSDSVAGYPCLLLYILLSFFTSKKLLISYSVLADWTDRRGIVRRGGLVDLEYGISNMG
jgi:hypothetical protein